MNLERMEGEGMTEFTIRRVRAEIIEECAAVAQRWADDCADFKDDPRCQLQQNVCRNLATAIRGLALPRPERDSP